MTKVLKFLLAGSLGAVVLAVCALAQDTDPGGAGGGWEHLALQHDTGKGFSTPELSRQIVNLGSDGWELVSVENFEKNGTTISTAYFFKRRK